MFNRPVVAGLFAAAALIFGNAAIAAKVGVRVLDANTGLPVHNASVCLGPAANPTLYGTGVTSYSGVALYDNVPNKSVLITVSKQNYRGIALQSPHNSDNVITDVLVTEGLSSKKCRAMKLVSLREGITRGDQSVDWPLAITALSYFPSGDDGLSFLSYADGKPTHYRVSADPQFKDAQWKPYSDVLHYARRNGDTGSTTLYFQLRKSIVMDEGVIDAVSLVTTQVVAL